MLVLGTGSGTERIAMMLHFYRIRRRIGRPLAVEIVQLMPLSLLWNGRVVVMSLYLLFEYERHLTSPRLDKMLAAPSL